MCAAQNVCLLALCAFIALAQHGRCVKLSKWFNKKTKTREITPGITVKQDDTFVDYERDIITIGFTNGSNFPKAADGIHLNTPFYQLLTKDIPSADVEYIKRTYVLDKRPKIEATITDDSSRAIKKSESKMKKFYALPT